ncbi:MAG TPA: zinc-ribbon domain-containing protein [Thermoplasmata archaeon]|nr:zinc-ribbon domain-containing protein [Thermoplasmata archaeon]
MPACQHCGELAADGALFCPKCGYTLPQVDTSLPPPPPPRLAPVAAAPARPGVPIPPPPASAGPGAYPLAPGTIAAATPAMPPPPSGKYCIRCGTIISRAAVYCPVCQQPQTP